MTTTKLLFLTNSFVLFYRQQLALTSYQKQCTWRIEQWVIFSVCNFLHTAGWKPGSKLWSPSEVLNKIIKIGSWEKFITKLFLALWFLISVSHPKLKFVCKILVSVDLLCYLDLEKRTTHRFIKELKEFSWEIRASKDSEHPSGHSGRFHNCELKDFVRLEHVTVVK